MAPRPALWWVPPRFETRPGLTTPRDRSSSLGGSSAATPFAPRCSGRWCRRKMVQKDRRWYDPERRGARSGSSGTWDHAPAMSATTLAQGLAPRPATGRASPRAPTARARRSPPGTATSAPRPRSAVSAVVVLGPGDAPEAGLKPRSPQHPVRRRSSHNGSRGGARAELEAWFGKDRERSRFNPTTDFARRRRDQARSTGWSATAGTKARSLHRVCRRVAAVIRQSQSMRRGSLSRLRNWAKDARAGS